MSSSTLISSFLAAHKDLVNLVGEIGKLTPALPGSAGEVRAKLNTLTGRLKIHLAMEDRTLYPSIANNPDPQLQSLVKQASSTITGLADAYVGFATKWTDQAITADPKGFAAAWGGIAKALADRVAWEESTLYPAVDRANK